jgi:replicative DNA helicase
MYCNFVVEPKVGVNDRKFSSSQRTDRELSDEVGRSLPFSEDGEKVLCSLLLSPRDVLDLCQIKLRPEAFYAPAHQILFNLVAELVDSNKLIDFITLNQALKDRGQLDEIGGPEYLSDLFSFVPSAANADYYIDIFREKYLVRPPVQIALLEQTGNRGCEKHRPGLSG